MVMPANQAVEAVEVNDEVMAEIQSAHAHATAFYADGRNTLFDQITQEVWEAWDAADEKALVSDPDGNDLPDDVDCDLAA